MANITVNSTTQNFGQLFTAWNQLISYSQSITPDTITLYQTENAVLSAFLDAFVSFDTQVSDGNLVSYDLPNGATSGTITTTSWKVQLYGSLSSFGSTITKEVLTASNGVSLYLSGSLKFSGLPVLSDILTGSQIDSVVSTEPDPVDSSDNVLYSVTMQAMWNGASYGGTVSGYADAIYDSADQEYFTQNLSISNQTISFSPSSYNLSDATVTGENDDVQNASGAITDSVTLNGVSLDLNELDTDDFLPQLVAGSDVISFSGTGALAGADALDFLPKLIAQDDEMTSLTINASAAAIQGNLDALETLAQQGKLGSISLTDAGTPTIRPTPQQLSADQDVFAHIRTPYVLACYLAGTGIATPVGERAVESLAAGDLILTRSGEARPVVWIGHRRADCRRHLRPESVWPVRVRVAAFGAGLPQRDLFLSPDHAVLIDDVLIPIRYLVNGATIVQEAAASVCYWHVELDRHDVILAHGLPCESYLDTGNRTAFASGGAAVQMHPDFSQRLWDGDACAPLVLDGPGLAAAQVRLRARAEQLGHRGRRDPALRVAAAGVPATVTKL